MIFTRTVALATATWLNTHATVLFAQNRVVAALCLAATAFYPRVLLAGLAAWLLAEAVCTTLALPALSRPAVRTNALLTGLALAALWAPSGPGTAIWWICFPLTVLLVISLTLWFSEWLWQVGMLPALSLPFSLGIMAVLPALGGLSPAISVLPVPPAWAPDTPAGALLTTFGWIFLSPHPGAGALVILAMFVASRWFALLGLTGYALGHAIMSQLAPQSVDPGYTFNFPLAAMAVGGYYCRPGAGSFVLGLVAAALAALGCAAFAKIWGDNGIPALSLPFASATLLLLAAIRHAQRGITPVLAYPDTPERQIEAHCLAISRLGVPGSLSLAPPFLGEWQVYQGFDGIHTHRGPWRYALDFFIAESGKSYRNEGTLLNDYRCFGLPVLAPAAGEVVAVRDGLPDNPPGLIETRENWGNHVVIRMGTGQHVWLAHLRQGSVTVVPGAWVRAGERLGACGNSGRSPQPHLHLHVQYGPKAGEASLPFHLDNVEICTRSNEPPPSPENGTATTTWYLARVPEQGENVRTAGPDTELGHVLSLPVGRCLGFEVSNGNAARHSWQIEVTLTLTGQLRLTGQRASLAAALGPHAFALYDRQGGSDPWLDLFALALGLTPLSPAQTWHDAPPARLFPTRPILRAALWLTHPLGGTLDSRYHRVWLPAAAVWRQSGHHVLHVAPGWRAVFSTEADITPDGRIVHIEGRQAARCMQMRLATMAQRPDEGIPAWDTPVSHPAA